MKKHVLAAGAGLGAVALGAVLMGLAPPAEAITNPAQHPYPITVTIDGQTYHDGQDTLPGYDDEACTAIPDVQYDFGDNEILYYDDQGNQLASAPWTEWSRISSYQVWLKQHQGASSSPPTPKPSSGATHTKSAPPKSASSAPRKGGSTRGSNHSATGGSSTAGGGSGNAANDPAAGAAAAGSTTPDSRATSSAKTGKTGKTGKSSANASASSSGTDPAPSAGGAVAPGSSGAAGASEPSPSLAAQHLAQAVTNGIGRGAGNTRMAGLTILGVFAAAGLGLLLANFVRRHAFARRRSATH